MKVLIAGAAGSIGLHAVNAALSQGYQARAIVRTPQKAALLPAGVETVYADVSLPETLTDAVKVSSLWGQTVMGGLALVRWITAACVIFFRHCIAPCVLR